MFISNNLDGSEDKYVRCDKYISEDLKEHSRGVYQEEDFEENPFEQFDLRTLKNTRLVCFVCTCIYIYIYIEPPTCKNPYELIRVCKLPFFPRKRGMYKLLGCPNY